MSKPSSEVYAKYNKKNSRYFSIKLNRTKDAAIIEKLESQDSIQGYIRELVRKDIQQSESE